MCFKGNFFYSPADLEYTPQEKIVPSTTGESAFQPGSLFLFILVLSLLQMYRSDCSCLFLTRWFSR